jgi:cystathionine beta-lyase family protein involved in aluminum resistance
MQTTTQPATHNSRLRDVVRALKLGKEKRMKSVIQSAYDVAAHIDMEACDNDLFEEYDRLVTECNDILYS